MLHTVKAVSGVFAKLISWNEECKFAGAQSCDIAISNLVMEVQGV